MCAVHRPKSIFGESTSGKNIIVFCLVKFSCVNGEIRRVFSGEKTRQSDKETMCASEFLQNMENRTSDAKN